MAIGNKKTPEARLAKLEGYVAAMRARLAALEMEVQSLRRGRSSVTGFTTDQPTGETIDDHGIIFGKDEPPSPRKGRRR